MKKPKKEVIEQGNEPETAYLTTRVLERALSKATRNLSSQAMDLMGYVITKENNWVVKKYKDGTIERLHKIEKVKLAKNIDLR